MRYEELDKETLINYEALTASIRVIIEKAQYLHPSGNDFKQLVAQTQQLETKINALAQDTRWLPLYGLKIKPDSPETWSMRLPYGYITGKLNPLAAPVVIQGTEKNKLISTVTLEGAHEGPKQSVNGGTIAAIYDHLLSFASMEFANPGPTASLDIRYRNKTPLYTALRFETWVSKVDGKKIHTQGCCYAGDILCTEASALFINPLA